jgi:effector-binding domain-containing protein
MNNFKGLTLKCYLKHCFIGSDHSKESDYKRMINYTKCNIYKIFSNFANENINTFLG